MTTTPAEQNAINVAEQSQLPNFHIKTIGAISILNFGAKGDGTDESVAIQTALDYVHVLGGGYVIIPQGTFYAKKLRGYSNVSVCGVGPSSIIKTVGTAQINDYLLCYEGCSNVNIENLTFDGNIDNTPGSADSGIMLLDIAASYNFNIHHCTFQHNDYLGIAIINACDNIKIHHNNFIDTDCGIITEGMPSSRLNIACNLFDGHDASEPIAIWGSTGGYHEDITIIGNIIQNHTSGSGILVRASNNVLIEGNQIRNCAAGVSVTKATHTSIDYGNTNVQVSSNNIYDTSFGPAITMNNTVHGKISNNLCNTIHQYAIGTDYCSLVDIIDNNIYNANVAEDTAFAWILCNHSLAFTVRGNKGNDDRVTTQIPALIKVDGTSDSKSTNHFIAFNSVYPENKNVVQLMANADSCVLFGNRGQEQDSGTNNKSFCKLRDTMALIGLWQTADNPSLTKGIEITSWSSAAPLTINSIVADYPRKMTIFFGTTNITLKNGTGNLKLASDYTPTVSNVSHINLICDGTNWIEDTRRA